MLLRSTMEKVTRILAESQYSVTASIFAIIKGELIRFVSKLAL